MTTKCLSCGIRYEWPESCICPHPYDPFGYKISKWQWEGSERWEDLALKFICAKQERKKGRQDDNT